MTAKTKSIIFMCLALFLLSNPTASYAGDKFLNSLRPILIAKGVSKQQVDQVLGSPELKFQARMMARMLSAKESMLNYNQFLDKKVVAKGRKFMKKHKKVLKNNHKNHGVEPELVVALLSVETRLGANMGRFNVVNMLASQAVLDKKEARKRLKEHWPKDRLKEISSAKNLKRFKKRAKWAAGELAAIIKLAAGWKVSPMSLRGSAAGAMGMCQFMPTSMVRWAKDGDKDGKINLRNTADAIHSVGNYLQYFGWKKGISKKKKRAVLLKYNHSTPYANTIIKLASKLK
jgi:membrane-bound lytic murein transglycosylase B